MLKSMENKEQPKALRGREVIEEAGRLLRQMHFSANRGAYAEGQHVAVSVDPRWNDDNKTISVLITCHAFGHRQVDWAGLPVFVLPEGGRTEVPLPPRLDSRGQAVITKLPLGDYRLSASAQWGVSGEPAPLAQKGPWSRVYSTHDGQAKVMVARTVTGELVVAGETDNPHLAGATVRFSLVRKGEPLTQLSGELILKPCEEQPNLWEGRWVYQTQLGLAAAGEEENEFVFCVLSPSE